MKKIHDSKEKTSSLYKLLPDVILSKEEQKLIKGGKNIAMLCNGSSQTLKASDVNLSCDGGTTLSYNCSGGATLKP